MEVIKELPELFQEFAEQKQQSFLEVKKYKEQNIPIVGSYCSYFPAELVIAMGAISVGLCSSSQETVEIAEAVLPKSVCPLVKSSYGYAISDKCPYFHFSDLVVGETTCDGKKKMYEMMSEFKEIYVMELPNTQSDYGLGLWKQEIIKLKEYLEEKFQVVITEDNIREAIRLNNARRTALKRLNEVMKLDPVPVYGKDLFHVLYGNKYKFDVREIPGELDQMREQILAEYEKEHKIAKMPRIILTGCPIGTDSLKVVEAIEEGGGVVVAFENCTGAKSIDRLIDEDNPDVYQAIAERYLKIGCAVMTPNNNRLELLSQLIDEYQADGVVEVILSGCHSVHMESISVKNFVHEEKHIKYTNVVTDYSPADYGQLRTRMAAFVEMLQK